MRLSSITALIISWLFGAGCGLAMAVTPVDPAIGYTHEDIFNMITEIAQVLSTHTEPELAAVGKAAATFITDYRNGRTHIRFMNSGCFGKNTIAIYDPATRAIWIRRYGSQAEMRVTLVHELTHFNQNLTEWAAFSTTPRSAVRYSENVHYIAEDKAFATALLYYETCVTTELGYPSLAEFRSTQDISSEMPGWQKALALFSIARAHGVEKEFIQMLY